METTTVHYDIEQRRHGYWQSLGYRAPLPANIVSSLEIWRGPDSSRKAEFRMVKVTITETREDVGL